MIRTLLSAAGVVLALIVTVAIANATNSDQRGTAAPRERVLYVSVFDRDSHKPVSGLDADAFVVREDGTRREVLSVAKASAEMPLAILVDNSQAATPAISHLREALTAFVRGIEGLGPATFVTVADRPTIVVEYTASSKDLLAAANRLFAMPSSGATLLEAISDVAKGLTRRKSERAAIVVVTTENVEFSTLHHTQVLDNVRESGASLNAVVLRNSRGGVDNDEQRSRAHVLDRGPTETGGVRFDVLTSMAFDAQLRALAEILSSQYRVVYARPESLIPPKRVEVSMAKPGLEASAAPVRGQGSK